ncbi:ROK family transcriptional regulator [Spirochaeta africana]|uniref:Transcriptional regulator/sugar kinase n=1 Tax=Spirochaeta africana (strain ATCC 700263 / DSM 8902 / Z-7692) TaxID=889378 RepID=H9UL15_SPIAZ|nr:ROK family transcriptional regulator [Spirochaeta africana]AFG38208.1 transcriptional regulator/sugar kinase [Spirochaeta africana DSM 8902]
MNDSKPEQYAAQILSLLFRSPGLSRADLSGQLGIDRGMITRIVKRLSADGLVRERRDSMHSGPRNDTNSSAPGRRPIPLQLNDSDSCVLGLEVQRDFIKVSRVTVYGTIISTRIHPHPSRQNIRAEIIQAIERELNCTAPRVLGIGIAASGLADPRTGCIVHSPHLGVDSTPLDLQTPLQQYFDLPVRVDNDARCCCYDVMTYGSLQQHHSFLYLFCELNDDQTDPERYENVGIGSAIVLNGAIQYGSHSAAGEFRSIFANPDTHSQFAADLGRAPLRIKSDQALRTRFLEDLAANFAMIANYLDVAAIYLGGGIERYQEEARPIFARALHTTRLYRQDHQRGVEIHFAESDAKPAVRGAAALIARALFL